MSTRGKPIALACHSTKKVNKAEYLTYLSENIYFTFDLKQLQVRQIGEIFPFGLFL
jgi:hypothetical protein